MTGRGYEGRGQAPGEPPASGSSIAAPPARLLVNLTEADLRAIIREEIAQSAAASVKAPLRRAGFGR